MAIMTYPDGNSKQVSAKLLVNGVEVHDSPKVGYEPLYYDIFSGAAIFEAVDQMVFDQNYSISDGRMVGIYLKVIMIANLEPYVQKPQPVGGLLTENIGLMSGNNTFIKPNIDIQIPLNSAEFRHTIPIHKRTLKDVAKALAEWWSKCIEPDLDKRACELKKNCKGWIQYGTAGLIGHPGRRIVHVMGTPVQPEWSGGQLVLATVPYDIAGVSVEHNTISLAIRQPLKVPLFMTPFTVIDPSGKSWNVGH